MLAKPGSEIVCSRLRTNSDRSCLCVGRLLPKNQGSKALCWNMRRPTRHDWQRSVAVSEVSKCPSQGSVRCDCDLTAYTTAVISKIIEQCCSQGITTAQHLVLQVLAFIQANSALYGAMQAINGVEEGIAGVQVLVRGKSRKWSSRTVQVERGSKLVGEPNPSLYRSPSGRITIGLADICRRHVCYLTN